MTMGERDLQIDCQSNIPTAEGSVNTLDEHSENVENEARLTSFLKGAVVSVEPASVKITQTDKECQALKAFTDSDSILGLVTSLQSIIGEETYREIIPEWQRRFNKILLHGRSIEEFHDAQDNLLPDLSRIHTDGNAWFDQQLSQNLAIASSK